MNWYSSPERFLKSQERIHMQRVYTHANQRRAGLWRKYGVASEDTVAMLAASPSFDYSLAPERPMSIGEHEGSLYVLLHAFWNR